MLMKTAVVKKKVCKTCKRYHRHWSNCGVGECSKVERLSPSDRIVETNPEDDCEDWEEKIEEN